jgi:thioredoxin reductase (NADPH)
MHDVAVIGGGPAGISASIYLKRADIDVILFEKDEIGGLLLNAHLVENYPGFPNGISGKNLCKLFKNHLKKWKIKTIFEGVKNITIENNHYTIRTQHDVIKSKSVILSTGTIPKIIGIDGEQNLSGKLLFYEVKDILPKLKNNDTVIVIGGGDAAFDYSLNLAENDIFIDLYYRSNNPKCLKLLGEKVKKCSKIKCHSNFEPIKIIENQGKPEVTFKSVKTLKVTKKKSDYILIACGRKPNKNLIKKELKKNNIPGFYIAGDVITGRFRQVGIAVGEGIHVAMNVEAYVRGNKYD